MAAEGEALAATHGTRTMSVEERIRYLLRAALRAEDEGDRRVADSLRRMAREARPVDARPGGVLMLPGLECCPE